VISIVIPAHNEEEAIPQLYSRLTEALRDLSEEYEVIVVDDGSCDDSRSLLETVHEKDSRWKLLFLSRNFGHQTAISAGLYYSSGDVVAVMDADLQDPPEELHRFLQKWKEGYQVVYAIRSRRKESIFKRLSYWAFYRTLRVLSPINIPLDSGDFCVLDKTVVDVLRSLPERTRFIRGLRIWAGFRQIGVTYERQPRRVGETKYTIPKLFQLALDGIISFSSAPLKLASWIGFVLCSLSLALMGFVIVWWALDIPLFDMRPSNAIGWTSLLCIILLSSGVQMLMVGIMGEYVARIYDEVKGREPWIVSGARGIDGRSVGRSVGWYASAAGISSPVACAGRASGRSP